MKIGENKFVPLEHVVIYNLDRLFGGMEIQAVHVFRATRNADVERNEEEAEGASPQRLYPRRSGRWERKRDSVCVELPLVAALPTAPPVGAPIRLREAMRRSQDEQPECPQHSKHLVAASLSALMRWGGVVL